MFIFFIPSLVFSAGTLRLWSTIKGKEQMIGYKDLIIGEERVMARAVAWSPDGTKIVVGIGGRVGRRRVGTKAKHDGEVYIFRLNQKTSGNSLDKNFTPIGQAKYNYSVDLLDDEPPTNLVRGVSLRPHPRAWISDIKFGKQACAVAAHDNQIYLYNAQTFTLRCRCKGHSGSVLHIDFSEDGRVLQSTSNDYELLFWDVNSGKQITHVKSLRDQKWETFTCPLGWPVQGIWPKSADGTDINAVDLYQSSNDVKLIKNKMCNQYTGLLATVDDFGKVKLFNSPADRVGSASIEYRGHSAHVTNCRFTNNKRTTYLLTTGGEDRAIMQWKLDTDEAHSLAETVDAEEMSLMNPGWGPRSTVEKDQHVDVVYDPLDAAFEFGSAGAGDEFMAVKPWVGAIKAPTNPPPAVPNIVPETDLELKWVNGFNSYSTRSAVHYDHNGALHYPAATLNVKTVLKDGETSLEEGNEKESKEDDTTKYSSQQYCQKYNEDHRDDVLCLAMHKDGKTAASGAMGKKPRIVVYEVDNMKTINVLSGFHKRAVSSLSFCKDLLASVGEDESHSVAIYNWKTGTLVASAKGEKNKVFSICFNENGTRLAQCERLLLYFERSLLYFERSLRYLFKKT
jgi:microtubule-associated protein-like 6